jgi:predicted Rossmann fold flavoprotein
VRLKQTRMIHEFNVVILGAGAAGLMCAIEAGKRGRRVAVLERSQSAGKKILISGGGRCNFTNLYCGPENFLSANPHFAKSALARYTPHDFLALVEKHKIPWHEKKLGQLFCDRSARDILTMLEAECRMVGAQILVNVSPEDVYHPDKFVVRAGENEFRAPALVVATGGLSIPKIGATSFGYDLAQKFRLKILEPRPALVPLVLDRKDRDSYADLAGISADVVASFDGQSFREKMLFTHRGLSGPAILQISSYWRAGHKIDIDLAPDVDVSGPLRERASGRNLATLQSELKKSLSHRLADRFLKLYQPAAWTNSALVSFEQQLHRWSVSPAGTEGFDKAEVTAGGVDTGDLSAKTMESRTVPGLYFIGEVVDVTGHLGGFNFQWAWASGAAAGRAL